jgi:hypothetical protein
LSHDRLTRATESRTLTRVGGNLHNGGTNMKRFTFVVLLCATALTLISGVASARWSEPQPVSWTRYNASNVTGFPNSPDTIACRLEASNVDTSASFNLMDCDMPYLPQNGTIVADSLVFAYVTVFSDTSIASTTNFKAATCAVQVNWTNNSLGWATAKTYTCSQSDAQKAWVIPIFNSGVVANAEAMNAGVDYIQMNWAFAPRIRLIVTSAATTSVPMARIKVMKYRDPATKAGGGTTNW